MSDLTARMRSAIEARLPMALLAEIDHPDGMVRVWSKTGTLIYNGHEWAGLGILGSIAPVGTTKALMIREISFQLAGVPQESLDFLDANVRGRIGKLWLAAVKPPRRIVADPIQIAEARLDYQTYSVDDNGLATITLIGQVGFWTLDRAIDVAWSHEEQIKEYPTDTGLDLIPQFAQKDIVWQPPP